MLAAPKGAVTYVIPDLLGESRCQLQRTQPSLMVLSHRILPCLPEVLCWLKHRIETQIQVFFCFLEQILG